MPRRVLAILLMLAMPVPGAAVPHAHGAMAGTRASRHNQRPHLHLNDHHHEHGHSHEDGQGQPHAPCPSKHPEDNDSGTELDARGPKAPAPPGDHDDDALYVLDELGLNPPRAEEISAETGTVCWTESGRPTSIQVRSAVRSAPRSWAAGDSPIYLSTLSLRL